MAVMKSWKWILLAGVTLLGCHSISPTDLACNNDSKCPSGYICGPTHFCVAGTRVDGESGSDAGQERDAGIAADSGNGADAGISADAGSDTDAGISSDAGIDTDAGNELDAGPNGDAGSVMDAGSSDDAGTGADAGSGMDAGPQATVPGAPLNVTATAGNAEATVSWLAAETGGSSIVGYTVKAYPGGATVTSIATKATVTGLTNGTSYYFVVTATNAVGTGPASTPSNSVTPFTVPGAPTGVMAFAGDGQVSVAWSAPASDGGSPIIGYTVTANPGGTTVTTDGTTAATVTGLTNGTVYSFTVTATNAAGNGPASAPSNEVTPQAPMTVPDAPTNVMATPGDRQATVTWGAPASDGGSPITGYTVTATPGGVTVTTTGAATATVTGLTNGTSYAFSVYATNAKGNGPAATTANAVTPALKPGAPTNVVATAGAGQAHVTWSAPASDGGSAIIRYTVTASPGGATTTTTGATSATVTGLTGGLSYSFTVVATNAIGDGPASAPSNTVTLPNPPAAPTNVKATVGTNNQVTVTWIAPANGGSPITGYTVTASPGGATMTSTGTPKVIFTSGLNPDVSYTFTVYATSAAGNGSASAPSNAIVLVGPPSAGSTLQASGTALADGVSVETITAVLTDSGMMPVPGQGVIFQVSGAGNLLWPLSGVTNANGTVSVSLTSTQPGDKIVTAKVGGLILKTTVTFTTMPCSGTLTFSTSSPGSPGNYPAWAAAADFNGDGKLDLAIATQPNSIVNMLLGSGTGTFSTYSGTTNYPPGNPWTISPGDFNNDGKLDVALPNGAYNLDFFLGAGTGGFTAGPTYAFGTGSKAWVAAAGDFNGDGLLDVAAADRGINTVIPLVNDGTGSYFPSLGVPTGLGTGQWGITVADFNNDGIPDIATANSGTKNVDVMLGDGSMGFSLSAQIDVGAQAWNIAAGDFNGDGNIDLVVANANNVSVLIGDGSGGFSLTPVTAGRNPYAVAVGDLNGDGNLDLVVTNTTDNTLSVLLGNGQGAFTNATGTPISLSANQGGIAIGDFNGDGKQDIAVTDFYNFKLTLLRNTCR